MDTLSDLRNNLSLKEQDILATNLSLVLEKQEKQKKEFALKKQDQLRSVLNGMEAYICVSSAKNFDILFLNTVMIKAFKLEGVDYIGKKCYKVLQGLDEKCPDCPHTKLIDAPNKTLN